MKRILSFVLVLTFVLSLFSGVSLTSSAKNDLPSSGSCGENVTYTFDSSTGKLTISGSGAITDYSNYSSYSPFYSQTGIKTVVIQSGVTSIGRWTFYGCSDLTNITIPNSVASIGTGAFQGSGLKSIIIPNSIKTIESWVFYNCSNLTSVLFSDSVTSIESEAFRSCCSLKSITFPKSLKSIGYNVFFNCNSLVRITIPVSVTSIEAYAFSECEALKDVYYTGKKEQWQSIYIGEGNISLVNATLHAPGNELDFSKDVWKFKNFSHSPCYPKGEFPYLSQLKPSSRSAVKEALWYGGDGHCFGMSATVILQKIGQEDFTQWSGVDNLRQLDNSGTPRDRICYYHAMQVLADYQQEAYKFSNNSVKDQLRILADKADSVKSGGNPVLLTISSTAKKWAHAVVAYAVESGEFTSSSTGRQYNRRILLYDCNAVNWKEDYCLLFNQGTAEWEIPVYANDAKVTSYDDAVLLCATNNPIVFDKKDDFEMETDIVYCPVMWLEKSSSVTIKKVGTNETWSVDAETGAISGTSELKSYWDISDNDGAGNSGFNVILPDNGAYSIVPKANQTDKLKFHLLSPDKYFAVESTSAKGAEISTNGSVSVKGNTGDYQITLASDTAQHKDNYDTYTVSGKNNGDTKLELTKEGVTVDGDDIKGSVIDASNESVESSFVVSESKSEEFSSTVVPDSSHNHEYQEKIIAPGKTTLGYTLYTCECGESYKDSYKAPTGKLTLKHSARTANAIKVQWNNVKTATGYQVQISTKDGKKWSTYATLKAGVTSYTFKSLAAGNNYKFRVRFYIKAADGKNYYSPWSAVLTSPTLPNGTTLTGLARARKGFTAKWKKGSCTGYQLQYSTNAKFSKATTKTIKGAAKVKLAVKSLKANTKYFVRVRTYKTIGGKNYFSTWSGAKSVKTK